MAASWCRRNPCKSDERGDDMGIPVLIIGESGSGKSTSLRNFEPGEIGIFNVASKPLRFAKAAVCKCGRLSADHPDTGTAQQDKVCD